MKGVRFRLWTVLAAAVLFCSCGRLGAGVEVLQADPPVMHGSVGCDLNLTVRNAGGWRYAVREATVSLYYKGVHVGDAELRGKVILRAHGTYALSSRWKLFTDDPAALHLLLERLTRGETDDMEADVSARVGAGMGSRKISTGRVPVREILRIFAVSNH